MEVQRMFGSGWYTHVTPQWAGGLALELMLGTVGTGASEWVRCVGVGAAGVGVGAARGAPSGGTSELLSGALSPVDNGPWNFTINHYNIILVIDI